MVFFRKCQLSDYGVRNLKYTPRFLLIAELSSWTDTCKRFFIYHVSKLINYFHYVISPSYHIFMVMYTGPLQHCKKWLPKLNYEGVACHSLQGFI